MILLIWIVAAAEPGAGHATARFFVCRRNLRLHLLGTASDGRWVFIRRALRSCSERFHRPSVCTSGFDVQLRRLIGNMLKRLARQGNIWGTPCTSAYCLRASDSPTPPPPPAASVHRHRRRRPRSPFYTPPATVRLTRKPIRHKRLTCVRWGVGARTQIAPMGPTFTTQQNIPSPAPLQHAGGPAGSPAVNVGRPTDTCYNSGCSDSYMSLHAPAPQRLLRMALAPFRCPKLSPFS